MSGGWERYFKVHRTLALKTYTEHLENKPDAFTVGELLEDIKQLLVIEGFYHTSCNLAVVVAQSGKAVPVTMTFKELRQATLHHYRLRLFFESYMDLSVLRV